MSFRHHKTVAEIERAVRQQVDAVMARLKAELGPALGESLRQFMPKWEAYQRGEPADCDALVKLLRDAEDFTKKLVSRCVAETFPMVMPYLPANQWAPFRAQLFKALHTAALAQLAFTFDGITATAFETELAEARAKDAGIAADGDALLADIFKETPTWH